MPGPLRIRGLLRTSWALFVLCASSQIARAQFQQPFVFSGGGAVVTRNDASGILTPIAGSPFSVTNVSVIDVQGRFLFAIDNGAIAMYPVDSTTGVVSPAVKNGPFASQYTNQPTFLAVEPSGKYLAAINRASQMPGQSSVDVFQIDPIALTLTPVSNFELHSTVLGAGADRKSRHFYAYLGPNPFTGNQFDSILSELDDMTIDAATGIIVLNSNGGYGNTGRCFGMDPWGRFAVIGHGELLGSVDVVPISPDTGAVGSSIQFVPNPNFFPTAVSVDASGKFVYVGQNGGPNAPVAILAYDSQGPSLSMSASSPLPGYSVPPEFSSDPTGPFMYGQVGSGVQAFISDPVTGYISAVAGTQNTAAGLGIPLVFSIPPNQQDIVGPLAMVTPTALSLGNINTNTPSPAQQIIVMSTGDQALSLNGLAVTGANAADFAESDTCAPPTVLQPVKSCTISIIFTPAAAGSRQAMLVVTDNSPQSPQIVMLSGTGVTPPPPAPAVTLTPGTVSFPTTTQGLSSAAISVLVSNSGNAPLHITAVTIGGNNSNDFSSTNNCTGSAVAASGSCTISIIFSPLAAGERTETITLTDDAADKTQVINISGNATAAAVVMPAAAGGNSVIVSAGQTAQFALSLAPASNFTGSVSMTCSGAPLAAVCSVPATIAVSNGVAAPFTVTVTTTGAAATIPYSTDRRFPFDGPNLLALRTVALFVLLILLALKTIRRKRLVPALSLLLLVGCCCASGCGGGTTTTQQQMVTPKGTSTIVLTPSATSNGGKAVQLPPVQLTLTVN